MSSHFSQAKLAKTVKLTVEELERTLSNVLKTAHDGLSDRHDNKLNFETTSRHGIG